LIKNSQQFGKKFQKTVGGDFFFLTLYTVLEETLNHALSINHLFCYSHLSYVVAATAVANWLLNCA